MTILLNMLDSMQLSIGVLSIGTGLMLGTFVGQVLPVRAAAGDGLR